MTTLDASPFPSLPTPLRRQSHHTPLHSIKKYDYSVDYHNYSDAFSESTAYDNSDTSTTSSPSSSSLTRHNSTRQIEAFGTKVFSAISESVRAPPAVAALSRTKSLHARAKSLASFIPSLNPASVEEEQGSSTSRPTTRGSGIFSGAGSFRGRPAAQSEHDIVEQDIEQDENPFIMDYKSTLTGGLLRPSQATQPSNSPEQASRTLRPTAGASAFRKFSWFGASKQQSPPVSEPTNLSADPSNADLLQPATSLLFPHGTTDSQDPASFTELLKNAELLITRLQTAYKQQEAELKTARQEREAAAEEAAEAETRARHLKLQLTDMCRKVDEQEATIKATTNQLASERLSRVEEHNKWERSQRRAHGDDEPTPKRRTFRSSAASSNSLSSDSGFESDYYAETETDATSSRPMTPLLEQQQQQQQRRWNLPTKEAERPGSRGSLQERTCQVDVGVWSWMREEKGRLETRVRELELVVDGCLDLVS